MTAETINGTIRHRICRDGTFGLRTVAGSVRLRGVDGDEVSVTARSADGDAEPLRLSVRRSERELFVEPARHGDSILGVGFGFGAREIEFEVSLPRGARVELNSVSADVYAAELTGRQSYRQVSGDLRLEGGGGRNAIQSVSGDVEVRAEQPVELEVTTTSGDVGIEAGDIIHLAARSVSGDIRVRGRLAQGAEHRVETVSGDLQLLSTGGVTVQVSGSMAELVSAIGGRRSGSGQRTLVVGDGSARLQFRSMSGEAVVEGGPTYGSERPVADLGAEPEPGDDFATPPGASEPEHDSLDVLRALERGEIDVDEAARRLAGQADDA